MNVVGEYIKRDREHLGISEIAHTDHEVSEVILGYEFPSPEAGVHPRVAVQQSANDNLDIPLSNMGLGRSSFCTIELSSQNLS